MSDKIEGVPQGMRIARFTPVSTGYKFGGIVHLLPDNVYGKPLDQVPDPPGRKRKEPLEFREPGENEHFITSSGTANTRSYQHDMGPDQHRIILEPPVPPQARVWLFREDNYSGKGELATYSYTGERGVTAKGTATELPQKGTPEWEALLRRLGKAGFNFARKTEETPDTITITRLYELVTQAVIEDLLGGAK